MRSLLFLTLLTLLALAPHAAAFHCPSIAIGDDGWHGVSQTGTTVTVNAATLVVSCFGVDVTTDEVYTVDLFGLACGPILLSSDGIVTAGVLFVNTFGVDWDCGPVTFHADEIIVLP